MKQAIHHRRTPFHVLFLASALGAALFIDPGAHAESCGPNTCQTLDPDSPTCNPNVVCEYAEQPLCQQLSTSVQTAIDAYDVQQGQSVYIQSERDRAQLELNVALANIDTLTTEIGAHLQIAQGLLMKPDDMDEVCHTVRHTTWLDIVADLGIGFIPEDGLYMGAKIVAAHYNVIQECKRGEVGTGVAAYFTHVFVGPLATMGVENQACAKFGTTLTKNAGASLTCHVAQKSASLVRVVPYAAALISGVKWAYTIDQCSDELDAIEFGPASQLYDKLVSTVSALTAQRAGLRARVTALESTIATLDKALVAANKQSLLLYDLIGQLQTSLQQCLVAHADDTQQIPVMTKDQCLWDKCFKPCD